MKAMVAKQLGGPEVLEMAEVDEPELGRQDVLIEVHASAVNPVDTKIRQGMMGNGPRPPLILGFDVSGVVRAVGERVEGIEVGDEVYASPNLARPGANAELVAVDARTAATRPENLSHVESAALPLVTITAWEALHQKARLHRGETILIQGGGGGVGHIAIQLARLDDCRVIATASRDESIDLCRQCGADVVINYRDEDVVQRVQEETGGQGCPVVLDTVGGEVFTQSLDCLAVHGRLATILPPPSDAPLQKLLQKDAIVAVEFMGASVLHGTRPWVQGETLQTVTEYVEAGRLGPHVSHVFDLADLADAHRQQETGHTTGKIGVRGR
ncbi:MAG: quinone oxidoreductase family protein [Phycisphaeraceae bacterium]